VNRYLKLSTPDDRAILEGCTLEQQHAIARLCQKVDDEGVRSGCAIERSYQHSAQQFEAA